MTKIVNTTAGHTTLFTNTPSSQWRHQTPPPSLQSQRSKLDIESHHGHASLRGGPAEERRSEETLAVVTRLCTLCSQQPPANGASFYAACLLTYTEAETQRHCIAGYRVLQDTEYCSTAAHSWSEWRASGRNLAVRVPSHSTPHRDMSPMGAPAVCCHLCHHQTFSTALAADAADTNICSELGPAACSTLQHSQPLRSTAQVCPGPRRSADCPHRAEHCTHPHHCTVLYCTALYMCGEEMCFVFMVDKYL